MDELLNAVDRYLPTKNGVVGLSVTVDNQMEGIKVYKIFTTVSDYYIKGINFTRLERTKDGLKRILMERFSIDANVITKITLLHLDTFRNRDRAILSEERYPIYTPLSRPRRHWARARGAVWALNQHSETMRNLYDPDNQRTQDEFERQRQSGIWSDQPESKRQRNFGKIKNDYNYLKKK